MGKIRLIALDVDGTLLDDQKRLPPAHREALEEAASRGILIAIASGRMTPTIEPIQDLLGIDCILIAYNGARVLGSRRERRALITHCPLPADVAGVFIEFSREREYLLNFYHEDRLYAEGGPRRLPFIEIYSRRTGARYEIVDDLSRFRKVAPTKLILLSSPEERDRFHDEFRAALRERAFITKSDPEYLEVMAPGVDKGTALDLVAKHYGIPLEEVMAVGDAENDIGMLRMAGLGVAMQNAPPHVKDAARVVTEESNNEGGVAGAIRRWAL
ncbi:MAG TPA: Cof-type HAD-IIB family hydrolase [Planctomycetota bacterium]|nr:Cof-type HAD-IIB family hydrolase [Planctomycetota bacterium]